MHDATFDLNNFAARILAVPAWIWRSLFWQLAKKPQTRTAQPYVTAHGEFIDASGRVEFLSPFDGC